MNKRGSAHLEMIMSFVIFVSFTLFLLYTIDPPRKNVIDDSSLLSLKEKFFQNVSINLTIVLVNTSCKPTDFTNARLININGSSSKYYAYNSSELIAANNTCTQGTYQEGYRENREVLSNKSLFLIKELYSTEQGYELLKQQFGLARGVDFAILSRGYNMVPNAGIPETNVPAYGYQKQVLYSNGTLVLDTFTIRTW